MVRNEQRSVQIERGQNLWTSFVRRVEPLGRGAVLTADPQLGFDQIGGLAGPKDEILTYACAATNPEVYSHWGTFPPSGLMMIGAPGCGKSLLAQALACRTNTSFLRVDVPRMVLDVVHGASKVGELVQGWSQVLEEMPPLTVYFDELEFSQAYDFGGRRPDLPVGPIMDFLLELIDRTAHCETPHLLVGATGYPDTLRHAFTRPGRFERVVEVTPNHPDDVVEALRIHARTAEARSGRTLFVDVDWKEIVSLSREPGMGDWVRILHGVLRRKARQEAAGEAMAPVSTADLRHEVSRYNQARERIKSPKGGNYI